jgi:hypothetical protein
MACIIAELLLFSRTLTPRRLIRTRAGYCQCTQAVDLTGVMHLLFKIFHANMENL